MASRDPSIHPSVPSSIHGWHRTGKKTLAEINNPPPLRTCRCLGKACLALVSSHLPWSAVCCYLTGHKHTSRFLAARVPMDTCGIWYIERFWKNVVCSCNFVICNVKYTHTCALGTGFKLIFINWQGQRVCDAFDVSLVQIS